MKPIDIRNQSFVQIRDQLGARLASVYAAWVAHGPATTRQLAERAEIDILNVRPRTTDLYGIGLVELVSRSGGEGVYRARTCDEWQAWRDLQREAEPGRQLNLI